MSGWVLMVVITHGLTKSQLQVFTGFATKSACETAAQQSVQKKDRWTCFYAGP